MTRFDGEGRKGSKEEEKKGGGTHVSTSVQPRKLEGGEEGGAGKERIGLGGRRKEERLSCRRRVRRRQVPEGSQSTARSSTTRRTG